MWLQLILYPILAIFGWILFSKLVLPWIHQYHYSKQGVPFSCWWAPIADMITLAKIYDPATGSFPMMNMLRGWFGKGADDVNAQLPGISGMILAGNPFLNVGSPEAFEQIFIHLAKYVSKNPVERDMATLFMPDAIFFKESDDADFKPRRHSLSSSLFKAKLLSMMEDIKKLTLIKIKERENETEFDIIGFFLELQASVIIQFAIGGDKEWDREFMYEQKDGSKQAMKMYIFFNQLVDDLGERMEQPLQFMFTGLLKYEIGSFDNRYVRNMKLFRQYFIDEIDQRMKTPRENGNDLMSMLIKDPVYKGKESQIIDDVWGMLIAGMKTI